MGIQPIICVHGASYEQCSRLKSSMPFKRDLVISQNSPSKHNPDLKMKTSLEVLNILCPPQNQQV